MYNSILDNDLYKFTTSYAYMKKFPQASGTFEFINRGDYEWTFDKVEQLKEQIKLLKYRQLTKDELSYCYTHIKYIPLFYWEWLSNFRFDTDIIEVYFDETLHIRVTDYLYKVTLYEVPILAIVSEFMMNGDISMQEVIEKLSPKIDISNVNKIPFSDFGTRRRFNYNVQSTVLFYLKQYAKYFTGTSNVNFSRIYNLTPIGTHPHEWIMFHGAMYGYKHANYLAMENWADIYDGDLGIALADTYTTKAFFSNLSLKHAKLYDGLRCDSGDEIQFINNTIKRYEELGINPHTKTIIFSNGLTFDKILNIYEYGRSKINLAFGIGTNLTNDVGYKPANIVMKLTECRMNNNQPIYKCIKLSDDYGKYLGSDEEMKICKYELNV